MELFLMLDVAAITENLSAELKRAYRATSPAEQEQRFETKGVPRGCTRTTAPRCWADQ